MSSGIKKGPAHQSPQATPPGAPHAIQGTAAFKTNPISLPPNNSQSNDAALTKPHFRKKLQLPQEAPLIMSLSTLIIPVDQQNHL